MSLYEATVGIEVPRDRDSSFDPVIVGKRQRRLDGIDEIVLSLTARGLTTGGVSAHFEEVYGAKVSKDTISRITDKVLEDLAEWGEPAAGCSQSLCQPVGGVGGVEGAGGVDVGVHGGAGAPAAVALDVAFGDAGGDGFGGEPAAQAVSAPQVGVLEPGSSGRGV